MIKTLIDIAFFKAGPQNLPGSRQLTFLMVIGYFLTSMLTNYLVMDNLEQWLPELTYLSLIIVGTSLILWKFGHPERINQTLTAITGVSILLKLVSMPVIQHIYKKQISEATFGELEALLYFSLVIWSTAIAAHIYRNALSSSFGFGLLVALSLETISVLILFSLFGVAN